MMLWGYGLRWIIAGRYPLSNHYESMAMCALGASLLTAVLELVLNTKRVVGMSGSLVGCILLVLANEVPTFAEQGFVAPLVPALQTVWMTIHVPVIMIGYAMGMLLAVLGHVHLIKLIAHKDDPSWVESIEKIMYRVLQLTVLFLLVGIILGAVWAGEAWGRPWGWDMKETWALITLLCYLAMLHARFVGFLKPFWMSVSSLFSFAILILTYYGVNFLFGKGLHTYGFGSGDWFWLSLFFAIEALLVAVATVIHFSRGPQGEITGDAMKLREE
jgi:cytochrome c-type biogenesis protein CcsB